MTTDDSILGTLVGVLLVVLALPMLMMVVMGPAMMGGWGMHGTGGEWNSLWMLPTMVIPLLLLLGLGYLVYRTVASGGEQTGRPTSRRESAIAELRTAYARGELTDEEFERRRETLQRTEN